MGRIKITLAALLLLSLLLFVAQNTDVVGVRFLFWRLEMSRSILLFAVFALGATVGWLTSSLGRMRHEP